jgi:hypothetical protein
LAPGALAAVFILMFFTWVRSASADFYQIGWGTGVGENWSFLGLLYTLFFLGSLALALVTRFVAKLPPTVPPWAKQLWPWRSAITAGGVALALMFLTLQILLGFGIESHATASAAAATPAAAIAQYASFGELAKLTLHRTGWLELVFLCFLVALAGAGLDFFLGTRKDKPTPRVDICW